jgi:hypothetical protein
MGTSSHSTSTSDAFVTAPSTAFRFVFRHCGVTNSTPHSSRLARLVSGVLTKASDTRDSNEAFVWGWENVTGEPDSGVTRLVPQDLRALNLGVSFAVRCQVPARFLFSISDVLVLTQDSRALYLELLQKRQTPWIPTRLSYGAGRM